MRSAPEITPEGDIRTAFYLSYDEKNCDYLELDGSLKDALDAGETIVSASFIIPYPPGFPILGARAGDQSGNPSVHARARRERNPRLPRRFGSAGLYARGSGERCDKKCDRQQTN